jgi:hypothetical protein
VTGRTERALPASLRHKGGVWRYRPPQRRMVMAGAKRGPKAGACQRGRREPRTVVDLMIAD